jgi:hypothetical protein
MVPYLTEAKVLAPAFEIFFMETLIQNTKISKIEVFKANGNSRGTFGSILNKLISDEEFINKAQELAFTDATSIIDGEIYFEKGSYIIGADGSQHSVLGVAFKAKCRKEIGEINLDKGHYRDTAVAIGSGASFGRPVYTVLTENRDEHAPKVAIRIDQSQRKKSN